MVRNRYNLELFKQCVGRENYGEFKKNKWTLSPLGFDLDLSGTGRCGFLTASFSIQPSRCGFQPHRIGTVGDSAYQTCLVFCVPVFPFSLIRHRTGLECRINSKVHYKRSLDITRICLTIYSMCIIITIQDVPVAQLDRASASGAEGWAFESPQAHQPTLFLFLFLASDLELPSVCISYNKIILSIYYFCQ